MQRFAMVSRKKLQMVVYDQMELLFLMINLYHHSLLDGLNAMPRHFG